MLALFLSGEFLLHILCWLFFFFFFFFFFKSREFLLLAFFFFFLYLGSFSYTSRAGFTFLWVVSLTPPMLASFLSFFITGVSLTHPMLASFLSGEFLLHIPCWLYFCLGSFSYTPRAGFIFLWGVSLTHPMLALFLCGEFLLHVPYWLLFFFFFS